METRRTVAIIGGGVSGALTAYHLLEQRVAAGVVVIDPRAELGLGLAYSTSSLVRLRSSQINGCAYCSEMHSKECRALGETEHRVYELNAWRVAPLYTDRERAALAWTEAVTPIVKDHVPDHVYDEARDEFREKNLVYLTFAIADQYMESPVHQFPSCAICQMNV
jgi:AhpD family alkylhydroperoxidase